MNFIINPGSQIADEGVGYTNTHEQARIYAHEWFFKRMLKEGFADIVVTDTGEYNDGRWRFIFRHTVTRKEVELDIHGIDNLEKYIEQNVFTPRVYWNGSSSSDPQLEQFAADGFEPVMTFKEAE